MNVRDRHSNAELASPKRQPLLISAVLLSGLFLSGLLHPYVKPWVVLVIVIGVVLVGRIRPLARRLSEYERGRHAGAVRAVALSCTTVVVVLGSLEYLALGFSDLGVMQYLSGQQTPEDYAQAALEQCDKLGLQPWFRVRGSGARRPAGIFARGVEVDGERYVSLVNFGQERKQVRLDTAKGDTWYDVLAEKKVGGTVSLDSLEPRLLRFETR